jgi:hypothetical protein
MSKVVHHLQIYHFPKFEYFLNSVRQQTWITKYEQFLNNWKSTVHRIGPSLVLLSHRSGRLRSAHIWIEHRSWPRPPPHTGVIDSWAPPHRHTPPASRPPHAAHAAAARAPYPLTIVLKEKPIPSSSRNCRQALTHSTLPLSIHLYSKRRALATKHRPHAPTSPPLSYQDPDLISIAARSSSAQAGHLLLQLPSASARTSHFDRSLGPPSSPWPPPELTAAPRPSSRGPLPPLRLIDTSSPSATSATMDSPGEPPLTLLSPQISTPPLHRALAAGPHWPRRRHGRKQPGRRRRAAMGASPVSQWAASPGTGWPVRARPG